jgi:hypothetical protein
MSTTANQRHRLPRIGLSQRAEETPYSREVGVISYHFSLGNSFDGPIGFCARVDAETAEEAVTKLNKALAVREHEYTVLPLAGKKAVKVKSVLDEKCKAVSNAAFAFRKTVQYQRLGRAPHFELLETQE